MTVLPLQQLQALIQSRLHELEQPASSLASSLHSAGCNIATMAEERVKSLIRDPRAVVATTVATAENTASVASQAAERVKDLIREYKKSSGPTDHHNGASQPSCSRCPPVATMPSSVSHGYAKDGADRVKVLIREASTSAQYATSSQTSANESATSSMPTNTVEAQALDQVKALINQSAAQSSAHVGHSQPPNPPQNANDIENDANRRVRRILQEASAEDSDSTSTPVAVGPRSLTNMVGNFMAMANDALVPAPVQPAANAVISVAKEAADRVLSLINNSSSQNVQPRPGSTVPPQNPAQTVRAGAVTRNMTESMRTVPVAHDRTPFSSAPFESNIYPSLPGSFPWNSRANINSNETGPAVLPWRRSRLFREAASTSNDLSVRFSDEANPAVILENAMTLLFEMGFYDEDLNASLLRENGNDVGKVVEILTGN